MKLDEIVHNDKNNDIFPLIFENHHLPVCKLFHVTGLWAIVKGYTCKGQGSPVIYVLCQANLTDSPPPSHDIFVTVVKVLCNTPLDTPIPHPAERDIIYGWPLKRRMVANKRERGIYFSTFVYLCIFASSCHCSYEWVSEWVSANVFKALQNHAENSKS